MPGADLQVDVGELGGLGAARIDDDQRARRILGDLLERDARARDRVRVPRVLAEEERHVAVLEVGARRGRAEHAVAHPELAGLLLRERARAVARAERAPRRRRVRAGQVVPLAAAAVIEDRVAAVACRAPRRGAPPPRGSRCPSRSPRSVPSAPAAQRRGQAVARRSGSDRAGAPSRRRSPARRGAACRRAAARGGGRPRRRARPRGRSCTRTGCRRSASSRSWSLRVSGAERWCS